MGITVYGTPSCAVCKDVVRFLDSSGTEYDYQTIGKDIQHNEVNDIAGRAVRTVPVIMSGGSEITFANLRQNIQTSDSISGLDL